MEENKQSPENQEQTFEQSGETQSEQAPPPVQPAGKDSANLAMLCHLLGILTGFLGPLIIWLIKKDEDAFVNDQGKEALNFQITILLAWIVSILLITVCIGPFLLMAVLVLNIVFCILGAIKASEGKAYRYPVCLRLIK